MTDDALRESNATSNECFHSIGGVPIRPEGRIVQLEAENVALLDRLAQSEARAREARPTPDGFEIAWKVFDKWQQTIPTASEKWGPEVIFSKGRQSPLQRIYRTKRFLRGWRRFLRRIRQAEARS